MSWIIDWTLHIGVSESEFVRCLKQAYGELQFTLTIDESSKIPNGAVELRWKACAGGIARLNTKTPGKKGVAADRRILNLINGHSMWAQAWESSVWCYYLLHGNETIDAFHVSKGFCRANEWDPRFYAATSPEFHADQLAKVCRVPPARIQKYFRDWGFKVLDEDMFDFTLKKCKAYPEDGCEYGNGSQLWDLLKKLGFEEPIHTCGYYQESLSPP